MKDVGYKFWIGFNSFVLLFLAINICTIGVETNSRWPFLLGLCYMIYMSIYLSKGAIWKVMTLLGMGICGVLFYLLAMLFGNMPSPMFPLAGAHIAFSAVLAAGAFAHLKSRDFVIQE